MIGWYHIALAILAGLALALSSRTPRAWVWIFALAASYVVSVLYVHIPKPAGVWSPMPPAVTFLCDAGLALFIHRIHRERWEWWCLFVPVIGMSAISFTQTLALLTDYPPPLSVVLYASALEAINAVCLLLIGGIGAADLIGHGRLYSTRSDGYGFLSVAHAARARTTASKDRWRWKV